MGNGISSVELKNSGEAPACFYPTSRSPLLRNVRNALSRNHQTWRAGSPPKTLRRCWRLAASPHLDHGRTGEGFDTAGDRLSENEAHRKTSAPPVGRHQGGKVTVCHCDHPYYPYHRGPNRSCTWRYRNGNFCKCTRYQVKKILKMRQCCICMKGFTPENPKANRMKTCSLICRDVMRKRTQKDWMDAHPGYLKNWKRLNQEPYI